MQAAPWCSTENNHEIHQPFIQGCMNLEENETCADLEKVQFQLRCLEAFPDSPRPDYKSLL